MSVAVTADHRELASVAERMLRDADVLAEARAALNGDAGVPPSWKIMADLGWLGLHVSADAGGSGFGLLEVGVIAYELGRFCAPVPFLPTVVVAGTIDRLGTDTQRGALLTGLLDGTSVAGFAVGSSLQRDVDGRLSGSAGPVLCGSQADVIAVTIGDDLFVIPAATNGLSLSQPENLDPSRSCAIAEFRSIPAGDGCVIAGGAALAQHLFSVLAAAEAAGGAHACREAAVGYAKDRVAFGRPIGGYQAIKHHCANLLIDEELARAAAWAAMLDDDPVPGRAGTLAAVVTALAAFERNARLNIQIHGGLGYTWESDAHLYARRAAALVALVGPDADDFVELARSEPALDAAASLPELPPEARSHQERARSFVTSYWSEPEVDRHRLHVESGYLFPEWPAPWGLGADSLEALVATIETAGLPSHVDIGPGGWMLPIVLPTLLQHGEEGQQDRWVRPSLFGDLSWCQLFSEPGAGSDLASLRTSAQRVDAGWSVSGQKVWTTRAQFADLGLALVRTDPTAPKHQGLTCLVIDMHASGVTVRPLKDMTGNEEFNEVFLDDVFVPDEDVIGDVGAGWLVARTALGNERTFLGAHDVVAPEIWDTLHRLAEGGGPTASRRVGELVARARALAALQIRAAHQLLAGTDPGPAGPIGKICRGELQQRISLDGHALLGARAVFVTESPALTALLLESPSATIAGGTSEVLRNVIAERTLGLPREVAGV